MKHVTEEQSETAELDIAERELSQKEEATENARVSAGDVLRQAREEKGFSLETVHEATKIPLDALRAIEQGYTVRTLSPFYRKGFIKMYASFLHVDVSEVLDDYHTEVLPKVIKKEVDVNTFDLTRWLAAFLTRKRKKQLLYAAGAIVALFLVFQMARFIASVLSRPKQTKPPVEKVVAQAPAAKQTPTAPAAQAASAAKSVPAPAAAASAALKNVSVSVRAVKGSWLQVKSDGKTVFQAVLRTGSVETWMADNEIEISGRNINQLEFEINGKLIGTLGREERGAKKVVITKDGLSVK